jgi:hypothetical protein
MAKKADLQQRIEELERRVRDLEARPIAQPITITIPPPAQPHFVPTPFPGTPIWNPTWTITTSSTLPENVWLGPTC